MKTIKIFFRILSFPFFLGLLLVATSRLVFIKSVLWLRYGGETISYHKDFNPTTVFELLNNIKDNPCPKS